MTGFICGPRIYTYEGWIFEVSSIGGPWPLKADGSPRARVGRRFYAIVNKWYALPFQERESYRLGGGCIEVRD